MRQEGVITRWTDERGFGFITPAAGGPPIFVHVSAFPHGERPVAGEVVTFRAALDDRNRLRASDVEPLGPLGSRGRIKPGVFAGAVAIVFFGLLSGLAVFGLLPALLLALSVLLSVAAFVLYRTDKSAAIRGTWRVRESTLQIVSLLGGWPGALLAQQVYRHKTLKQPFQTVFWITVVLNCAALAWVASDVPIPF